MGCKYHSECGMEGGGCCSKDGSRVSWAVCVESCPVRPADWPELREKLAKIRMQRKLNPSPAPARRLEPVVPPWEKNRQSVPWAVAQPTSGLPPQKTPTDPAIAKALVQFFDLSQPCAFDGCQGLRDAYSREVQEAGPGCPGCRLNRIKNKFAQLAKEALQKAK